MARLPKRVDDAARGNIPRSTDSPGAFFDRFFGGADLGFPSLFRSGSFLPAVDVMETETTVEVKAEVPGLTAEQLDIQVTGDVLTIKGEKKSESESREKNFHRIERSYGSFSRTVELPGYADTSDVSAEMKDGVLSVVFPKKEEQGRRSVKVEVK